MNTLQTNTNVLQTIANNHQRRANWLPTNRKSQMVWLAALTGVTLIGQYVLLATTGLGQTAETLPAWFFVAEKILWGLRGMVEVAVVVYVGMTQHSTNGQTMMLWLFKAVLIALIVLTVGPVWGAHALNVGLIEILGWWGVVFWGALLAGISAVMLAAVSYAYLVQPVDDGYFVLPVGEYNNMLSVVGAAENEAAEARRAVGAAFEAQRAAEIERGQALAELRGMIEAVAVLRLLPASAQIKIAGMFSDGRPDVATLAREFEVSLVTVRGVLAKVYREQ